MTGRRRRFPRAGASDDGIIRQNHVSDGQQAHSKKEEEELRKHMASCPLDRIKTSLLFYFFLLSFFLPPCLAYSGYVFGMRTSLKCSVIRNKSPKL
jgi:hypothetical protein